MADRRRWSALLFAAVLVVFAVAGAAAPDAAALDAELRKMADDADSFKRSDAARALAREGSADAAKLLVELLQDEDPYVRGHTVTACGKLADPEAVAVIAKAARSKDALLRENVAVALGSTKSDVALPELVRLATKDRSERVRIAALDALWGLRGNDDAAAACVLAFEHESPDVRAAAVEAAGRLRTEAGTALVKAALVDPDEGVRCVARMELRFVDEDAAGDDLAVAAKSPDWRTRVQVVENALHMMDAGALSVLVELVGDAHPRVSSSAHRALVDITGKSLGRDVDLWRAWWEQNSIAWRKPKRRAGTKVARDPRSTTAVYHGLEVLGESLVFVLDASGSMREEMVERRTDERKRTRWEAACDELENALERLDDDVLVNVVVFQERVRAAFDEPRALTKSTRRSLLKFARKVTPGQRGDLLAGVLAALAQPGADSVYLLSDGAPSFGEHVLKRRVGDVIRSDNRRRKLAVHCVGFGAKKRTEKSFLERLARESMGDVVFTGE